MHKGVINMMYVKFNQLKTAENKRKISYCRNAPDRDKVIYRTEFPVYITEERTKPTSKPEDLFCEETISESPETEENYIQSEKNTSFSRILYRFTAIILLFTAIYLAEIKLPSYIESSCTKLIEYAKQRCNAEEQIQTNGKVLGEKLFVHALDDKTKTVLDDIPAEDIPSEITENQSFAGTIITESAGNPQNQPTDKQIKPDSVQVISKNMSLGSDKIYFTNRTSLEIDGESILNSEYPIEPITAGEESPSVLIVHTHGTEAYIDSNPDGTTRSKDRTKNIVRVGEELANVLRSYGISVIHSKTMHDEISYVKAYDNSKAEVKAYLEQYPSIKYVIDVHRDALASQGSVPVKTYTEINGESAAQLMFVMGTNASGGNHPNYRKNLTVAVHIQEAINNLYPGLMRAVNVRPIIFNQNLRDGCMILEVGSDANTLSEALAAVRMFGRGFVEMAVK